MTDIKKYLKYVAENENAQLNSGLLSQIDNEIIITHCAFKYSHSYFKKMHNFEEADKNLIESLSYIQQRELGIFSKRPKKISEKINKCNNLIKSILRPDLLAPQDFEKKQYSIWNIIIINFFLKFSKIPFSRDINFKFVLDFVTKTRVELFEIFEINYYFKTQFFKLNNLILSLPVSYLKKDKTIFYGDQKNLLVTNYETFDNFNKINLKKLSITNQTNNLLTDNYKFDQLPKLFKLKFYDIDKINPNELDRLIKYFFSSPNY